MAHTTRTVMCAAGCPPYRGRHTQKCLDDPATKCDGCLPRPATDGAYVCSLCLKRMAEDPLTLIGRYADLERILAGGGGGPGEHVTTTGRDPNMQLNQRAAAARYEIRHEIVGLVQLITEERGIRPPTRRTWYVPPQPEPDASGRPFIGPMPRLSGPTFYDTSIPSLCKFVARHATWLAAHDAAAEHAQLLRRLVRETYAVAYPAGVRIFPVRVPGGDVADCPATDRGRIAFAVNRVGIAVEVIGDVPCSGWLWTVLRPKDDEFPAELLCNHNDGHRWPAREWLKLGGKLAPSLPAPEPKPKPIKVDIQLLPPRRGDRITEFQTMSAATERRRNGNGFDLWCRGCERNLGETAWGIPVEALLHMWERHTCPGQREQRETPAVSAASERTAA